MSQVRTNTAAIQKLEAHLVRQKDQQQRLRILNKLAGHFMFTNYKKAVRCLGEIKSILKKSPNPDYQLNCHLYTAFIENQLYSYYLAEIEITKAMAIIEDQGDISQQIEVYIDYAGICINLNQKEKATTYLEKASRLLEKFPNERFHYRLICREGFLNLHYKNFALATQLLLESDKILNGIKEKLTLKDFYFRTLIYSGLGVIYADSGETEKSIKAYLKVVRWCESLGMYTRMSWHYSNLGNSYLANGDKYRAKKYFKKAINITDDFSQTARAGAFANLGYCYFEEGRFQEAMELYDHAKRLYREKSSRNFSNFAEIERMKGQLYTKMGKRGKARDHFGMAIEYAQRNDDYKMLAIVCKEIADFFAQDDNYEDAYDYLILYDRMLTRYMEKADHDKIAEYEIKYDAERRKQEAEMLRLESASLQLKALRAQMNPHFLFNALNAIQTYITSDNSGSAAKYLAKFSILMRQSLEYSDLEIISLEKELEFLDNYLFINQKLRFENKLRYKISVADDVEEDIMGIPTMIVQPYLENAIEHGLRPVMDGLVTLSFSLHDENTLLCVVEDNGIGRAEAARISAQNANNMKHRSMGTSITEKRLSILNRDRNDQVVVKTIDLRDQHTEQPSGTRIEILIPIETIQNNPQRTEQD